MKRVSLLLAVAAVCAVSVVHGQPGLPAPAPAPEGSQTTAAAGGVPQTPTASGANPFSRPGVAGFGQAPGSSGLPGGAGVFGYRAVVSPAGETESPVGVVCFTAPSQQQVDETAEDLRIMSLVLEQNLGHTLADERGEYKLGIPLLLKSSGRGVEASYLEGLGAVFSLRVLFPLVAPSPHQMTPAQAARSSEWERARQALAGTAQPGAELWRAQNAEPTQPYDTNLVETLKQRTLKLLRNASNLRHVRPEERVVIVFSGPPSVVASSPPGADEPGEHSLVTPPPPTPDAAPEAADPSQSTTQDRLYLWQRRSSRARQAPERTTVMTLSVKKSAADDFAAGKLSEEEFLQRAEVTTYLGPTTASGGWSPLVRFGTRELPGR